VSIGREFQDGELVPGTRYQVIAQIGAGGMGSVYLVEHTELGKRFVLKALLRELARRSDLVARLRQEWRALGRLNHPNIINVTDAGTSADGVPFYVMEQLEGETLAARILSKRRLPLVEALAIGAGVLDGLAAAHEIGIVHRDIKPPNIFLVGVTGVKLLDFGIAKIADSGAEVITARGLAIGTPRYMSPEQARGDAVDGRADLYAAGLILFEMLSGVGPFDDSKDANELLLAHLGKPAARLSWAATGVPPELDQIVAWLLAKNPSERPASARQVASALREIASRASTVSSSAPTPLAQANVTEASISAVPTNPLPPIGDGPTVVPPGGFTQMAPTDPVPSPIHGGTAQLETPRVGTPSSAVVTSKRISVGPAPRSSELDPTVAVDVPDSGDTLHSPAQFTGAPSSRAGAPGRLDRTLQLDELVPFPVEGGVETRTSVPLGAPGAETPPPVESGAPLPTPPARGGLPGWLPLALTGVVIATLVAIGTWVLIGSPASVSAPEVAAPSPVPDPAPPAATIVAIEPVVEPEPPAPPPVASSAVRPAAPPGNLPAKKPIARAEKPLETVQAAPPPTETVKSAPPPKPAASPPKKPGLGLPSSGL
jgi:eukaryotic-like serine/threonine-protein kinase